MCYALLSHCAHCAWTKRITYPRCTHAEMHDLSPQTCPRRMRRRHEKGGACRWCASEGKGGVSGRVGEWEGAGVDDGYEFGMLGGGNGDGEDYEKVSQINIDYAGEVRSIHGEENLDGGVRPSRRRIERGACRGERKRRRSRDIARAVNRKESQQRSNSRVDYLLQEKKRKPSFLSGNVLDAATWSGLLTSAGEDRRKSWCCSMQGGSSLRRPSQHVVKDLMEGRLDQVRRASGVTIQ